MEKQAGRKKETDNNKRERKREKTSRSSFALSLFADGICTGTRDGRTKGTGIRAKGENGRTKGTGIRAKRGGQDPGRDGQKGLGYGRKGEDGRTKGTGIRAKRGGQGGRSWRECGKGDGADERTE